MTFVIPPPSPAPMSSFSKHIWVIPLWILPKISAIPPFGFSVTTDPPFCSPKNQVIPTKILRPPVINNDRSLIWEGLNRWFIACENSRFSSLLTTRVVSYDETSQAAKSLERGLFSQVRWFKGTGSRFKACSFIEMLFFCWDMLYRLCKQYDHVIMLSKNQSVHSPGSHLHLINWNICK